MKLDKRQYSQQYVSWTLAVGQVGADPIFARGAILAGGVGVGGGSQGAGSEKAEVLSICATLVGNQGAGCSVTTMSAEKGPRDQTTSIPAHTRSAVAVQLLTWYLPAGHTVQAAKQLWRKKQTRTKLQNDVLMQFVLVVPVQTLAMY